LERKDEVVPLGVDFDTALGSERLADDVSVFGEFIRVRPGAQLVQQLRRSLHVGKEEGDGAGWEIGSHAA
jgi:hypothetical protein